MYLTSKNNCMIIGERIRILRTQMHLSKHYVAKYLGISSTDMTELERTNGPISGKHEAKLLRLFGDSVNLSEKLTDPDSAQIKLLKQFKEQTKGQDHVN